MAELTELQAVTMAANINADTVREQQQEIVRLHNEIRKLRKVLDRCEGGFLGVLDVFPSAAMARDILADIREVTGG